ncbi:MAG: diadenylate cyclase, partial [Bacteroidales bacterium]
MMFLIALNFINFRIIDVLDIFLVALLLFELYRLLKGTTAVRIFWGIASIFVIWKIVYYLQFTMLSEILGQVISVGVIALIVLFQPEIRKFLLYLGNSRFTKFANSLRGKKGNVGEFEEEIDSITRACKRMSSSKTGALIVLARTTPLVDFLNTGEKIDALVSRELLENIFFKNSPLHDGAVIIKNHRIAAARCILPVSKD